MKTRTAMLAVLLTAVVLPAQEEKPEVKAALKVLEKRAGNWSGVTTINKAELTPTPGKVKSEDVGELTLGGKFVESKSKDENGVEGRVLATYDAARGEYRMWYFDSFGTTSESIGKWDEKAKTLTWTSSVAGITTTANWKFVDDDTFEWDVVSKDGDGKLWLDMKGKQTRKKK